MKNALKKWWLRLKDRHIHEIRKELIREAFVLVYAKKPNTNFENWLRDATTAELQLLYGDLQYQLSLKTRRRAVLEKVETLSAPDIIAAINQLYLEQGLSAISAEQFDALMDLELRELREVFVKHVAP